VSSANHFVINYRSYNGFNQNPIYAGSNLNSTPVLPVYGFNFYSSATTNLLSPTDNNRSTGAGVSVNFLQNIVNISNDISNIVVSVTGNPITVIGNPGTLAAWQFGVVNPTLNLSADAVSNNWRPQIKPAGNALNGSQAGTSLNVIIPGGLAANTQYTGFNNNLYGGYNEYTYFYSASIGGPSLRLLSRSSAIDSALSGYGGGGSDLVPGAKITYVLVIINDGSADASTINITERVPLNTTFYAIEPGDHNNINYIDVTGNIHATFDLPSANVKSLIFKKNTLLPNGATATFNYSVTVN